ncbi:MAG: GNAT family N-acetyltransferase [Bacteroidales bacterium]|nr:GNAT family N-acetyltransferase [Bacteroidales bacterium]
MKSNKIELQLPTLQHKTSAESFKNDFFENQEYYIPGSVLLDRMEYEPWLVLNTNNRRKDTVQSGYVQSTTFFAVRKSDDKIIGIIDIRHSLESSALMQYCGHLGVSIRPSERKGLYFKEMMTKTLDFVKSLNIEKILIGCTSDNIKSNKMIQKCGGILLETKSCTDVCGHMPHTIGKLAYIYSFDLYNSNNLIKS